MSAQAARPDASSLDSGPDHTIAAAGCSYPASSSARCRRLHRTRLTGEVTVANHNDALKRNRQNIVRRARNRHYRTMMRTQIKKLNAAIDSGDAAAAQAALPATVSLIQRVAGKGIIHRRQAALR